MNDPATPNSGRPLTLFLLALCHSSELLKRFHENPRDTAADWKLSDAQIEMLVRGKLDEIQDAVRAELPGADVYAAVWVDVSSKSKEFGRPAWWLFA